MWGRLGALRPGLTLPFARWRVAPGAEIERFLVPVGDEFGVGSGLRRAGEDEPRPLVLVGGASRCHGTHIYITVNCGENMIRLPKRLVARFRRPEYTGENRCVPCTATNVAIALVASGALVLVAPWLAVPVLALSLVAIYLRGYLVPGTPELTKRYFPDRVLRLFDKGPAVERGVDIGDTDAHVPEGEVVEPETVLLDAGAVEPTADGTDLRLERRFADELAAAMDALDVEEAGPAELARILGVEDGSVTITALDDARLAERDGVPIAQWESTAALRADLAAEPLLAERYDGWDDLGVESRGRALLSLRIFLERCPECGGPVELAEESVESCCRTHDVVAATCDSCSSRLLELTT